MDSGVPFAPSLATTSPMKFTHFMGTNLSVFHNSMQNHDTHLVAWASNHFSHGMPDMSSHFPSSVSSPYVNPSFGSGGMMPHYSPFSFGGSHIPQTTLTVGGWNLPSYGSTFPGASAQMGGHSTYYTPSTYPSFAMPVPTNDFPMAYLHMSSGISSEGSQFYSMGNPLHEVPSFGGNIYPHMSNPCHAAFSLQAASSVSMPLHPFMNQYGGGYYPYGHGHGVYHNPSWLAISQNQSFLEPWSQMPQPIVATSPVTACHTGIISPTFASHVRDWSSTSTSDVESSSPTSRSHVGDLLLTSASHARIMSPATASHVGGIHTIEKHRRVICNPKLLCRICEGDHLTCLCSADVVIQEVWSLLRDPSGSDSSLASQPCLVNTTVMPMHSSDDTPLPLEVDASLDLVVSHPIQPVINDHVNAIFGRHHSYIWSRYVS
jgi:hypothetical protein